MKAKYWLGPLLLGIQRCNYADADTAWIQLRALAKKQVYSHYGSFETINEAIACFFEKHFTPKEQEKFLRELKKLIRDAKEFGLSLSSMSGLIYLTARIRKQSEVAGTFARAFTTSWTAKEEREELSYVILAGWGMERNNLQLYRATNYLLKCKWFSEAYCVGVCKVLLCTNPSKWFSSLAMMMPIICRLRGRVLRTKKKDEWEAWLEAEEDLLSEIQSPNFRGPKG